MVTPADEVGVEHNLDHVIEAAGADGASFDEVAQAAVRHDMTASDLMNWWHERLQAGEVRRGDDPRGVARFRRTG